MNIYSSCGRKAASGVTIDERTVSGRRIARIAIAKKEQAWNAIGQNPLKKPVIKLSQDETDADSTPIGAVDTGTSIEGIRFAIHPDAQLKEADVLYVDMSDGTRAYFQIIQGNIAQEPLYENNYRQFVSVFASQLGVWDKTKLTFTPVPWVPPAGALIYKAKEDADFDADVPGNRAILGNIPNTSFPIHANVQDVVTHNTAIIGVTGSGKSYLGFHLIEKMMKNGIKVMILDITRQHFVHLRHLNPTPLKSSDSVGPWWADKNSLVGIHQFAVAPNGFPAATVQFVQKLFDKVADYKLKAGVNAPARICVVLEEAHSLVPEWNQVIQQSDKDNVNKTARLILQGRKFGMGCLLITQRTANVTKTILNQCNSIVALQSFDQTGLDFLKNYMGEQYAHAICTLPPRTAVLVGKASSSTRPVIFEVTDFRDRWKEDAQQNGSAGSTEEKDE